MSDNVNLAALAGTCAADDVAGILYQRVKVAQGADGAATDVSSAAPLQVTGANGSFPVTDSGGTLSIDDGAGSITVDGSLTTVSTVTTITNVVHVDDNSGSLTVDGSTKLLDTGGSTAATVKAASTGAAATTDTALVVTMRDVNSNGQTTASASAPVVLPTDRHNTTTFSLTLSLDTVAYASGDVLADTQQANAFFNYTDGGGTIESITVIDEDDQGAAFDIYFFNSNVSLGTENGAPNISDANARSCVGFYSVATADYKDLGGVKIASYKNVGLAVKAVSGTDDLYIGVVNGAGTPTYTASGIKLVFGIKQD